MNSHWLVVLDAWHWWVLGIALVILEILSPGVFFLWLGIAAGIVGGLAFIWPNLDWTWQVLIFSLCSVASIGLSRLWLTEHPIHTDHPTLNRRGHQYQGRVFTLDAPIVNGIGKIRVDDTTWKIRGDDCLAGVRVVISGVEGVVLLVSRVSELDRSSTQ